MPYGPEWRACRKLAHAALSPSAASKYTTVQEDVAAMLALEILSAPERFFDYVRMCVCFYSAKFFQLIRFILYRAAGRIVLTVTYGLSIQTADSEVCIFVHALGHTQSQTALVSNTRGRDHEVDQRIDRPRRIFMRPAPIP